jgi:hypothetical protein
VPVTGLEIAFLSSRSESGDHARLLRFGNLTAKSRAHDPGNLREVGQIEQHGQFSVIPVLMNPAARQPPQLSDDVGVTVHARGQRVPAVREDMPEPAADQQKPRIVDPPGAFLTLDSEPATEFFPQMDTRLNRFHGLLAFLKMAK